jgi:hypothetical protein
METISTPSNPSLFLRRLAKAMIVQCPSAKSESVRNDTGATNMTSNSTFTLMVSSLNDE